MRFQIFNFRVSIKDQINKPHLSLTDLSKAMLKPSFAIQNQAELCLVDPAKAKLRSNLSSQHHVEVEFFYTKSRQDRNLPHNITWRSNFAT